MMNSEDQSTELQVISQAPRDVAVMPGFGSQASWELANRIGKAFAASTLVPDAYRNNVANCIVALEMANRMGASPLMVMQNLYIVHGNPGWSSKFLIASFNQCGRYTSVKYDWAPDKSSCTAWAIEKSTGERVEGPRVTLQMAKDEGWSSKNGSKWKTMPELMLMYRAAAFMIRTTAPEISMGLQTHEELIDVQPSAGVASGPATRLDSVRSLLSVSEAGTIKTSGPGPSVQELILQIDGAADYVSARAVVEGALNYCTGAEVERLMMALNIAWSDGQGGTA